MISFQPARANWVAFAGSRQVAPALPHSGLHRIEGSSGDVVHFLEHTKALKAPALNLHTPEKPFEAKVLSIRSLDGDEKSIAKSRYFEITLDLAGSQYMSGPHMRLYPGHHLAFTPVDKTPGKNHTKWYSVGSRSGSQVKILVSRAPVETMWKFQSKKALLKALAMFIPAESMDDWDLQAFSMSNHLANMNPGDGILVYGPHSNLKLEMPRRSDNVIMISSGVALASHLGAVEDRAAQKGPVGETWLLSGYPHHKLLLYDEQLKTYPFLNYKNTFSREGDQKRVHHLAEAYAKQLLPLLDKDNTYVHICGFENMGQEVTQALKRGAAKQGIAPEVVEEKIQSLKARQRWTEDWGER
jgi:hypothetical protein